MYYLIEEEPDRPITSPVDVGHECFGPFKCKKDLIKFAEQRIKEMKDSSKYTYKLLSSEGTLKYKFTIEPLIKHTPEPSHPVKYPDYKDKPIY